MKALQKKYLVSIFDPKFKNLNLINKKKTDVIFNALHGKNGKMESLKVTLNIKNSLYTFWSSKFL